jgi:hypothetical protein
MWILPRQLHTSPFVPDTEALISDLNEQSQVCAQSLLVRSKVSPARTWSLKWKRDSWTQLLSGRILKPSHGQSFTAAWTSYLAAIRASHSARPASASAPKIHDTSGRTYQPELLQCDQVAVSLKTSRDISRWGCPTSSKTWQDWVTERRGAFSARLKLARRIKESASSSWPTVTTQDSYNTPCASQMERNTPPLVVAVHGPLALVSSSLHGSRQGLSWATPAARDTQGQRGAAANARKGNPLDTLPNQMAQWGTPTARDHKSGRGNEDRQYKELTPMVERTQAGKLNQNWVCCLMGVPMGWVDPLCPVSVIKNWPRFVTGWVRPQTAQIPCDFSEMELSLPPQSEPSEFSLAS